MLQLPGSSLELYEQFSTMFQGWWIENISVLVFTTFSERLSTRARHARRTGDTRAVKYAKRG